jgi:hypothetical protein
VLKHNQALKTYGGEWATDTGTETVTVTETVIDNKIEYNNKVDQIFNIENLK